jgi:hypothetical protein
VLIFAPLIVGCLVLGLQPGLVFNLTDASAPILVDAFRAATGASAPGLAIDAALAAAGADPRRSLALVLLVWGAFQSR